jgi:2-methylisocitrate lyase-like PEP mutase family enzyme
MSHALAAPDKALSSTFHRRQVMSKTQSELYQRFLDLHRQAGGFVMPNAWDGLSALLLKDAGFHALGTSSAALAFTLGRLDGRHAVSRKEHLAHAALLNSVSDLPINGDFEDGYGETPDDVAVTVEAAIAAGLAGIGIEDTTGNSDKPLRDFDDAVARVAAAAKVAKGRIVLTGRTDNYLQGNPDLADTIKRLVAFAEVGADVLYAPYPSDMSHIAAIVKAVAPKPVNVLVGTMEGAVPVAELQQAGVKRVSMGASLYARVMGDLKLAAKQLAEGDTAKASKGLPFREAAALIKPIG